MPNHFEIQVNERGLGSVMMNGQPVKNVRGVEIVTEAGEPTQVKVAFSAASVSVVCDGARVTFEV